MGSMATGDVRVMSVLYDNQGTRHRNFDQAVQFMESFSFADFPIVGPLTVLWCCLFIRAHGGSPTAWHQRWMLLVKLQPTDPYAMFHETLLRILEFMVQYDQLGVCALASAEYIMRQVQLIEERYKEKVIGAASETTVEAALYAGQANRTGLCICPALSEWIAGEMRGEAAVMKERRKAREERALAKPGKT